MAASLPPPRAPLSPPPPPRALRSAAADLRCCYHRARVKCGTLGALGVLAWPELLALDCAVNLGPVDCLTPQAVAHVHVVAAHVEHAGTQRKLEQHLPDCG
eukprot:6398913-Prymnesium_polylepis.2